MGNSSDVAYMWAGEEYAEKCRGPRGVGKAGSWGDSNSEAPSQSAFLSAGEIFDQVVEEIHALLEDVRDMQ